MGSIAYIIADDDQMRDVLARVVASAGSVPIVCETADAFLREAGTTATGCVLIDLQRRDAKGSALLDRLAERGLACPVFLFGRTQDEIDAAAAKRLNAVVIDKPFNVRLLALKIRAAVRATGA
jgi:FixJ family two-component response regulator